MFKEFSQYALKTCKKCTYVCVMFFLKFFCLCLSKIALKINKYKFKIRNRVVGKTRTVFYEHSSILQPDVQERNL